MSHYADSSFLVSCYVVDANTAQAKTYLSRSSTPLVFTVLHRLEVLNAFRLGVFRGLLTAADGQAAWRNVDPPFAGRVERRTLSFKKRELPEYLFKNARFAANRVLMDTAEHQSAEPPKGSRARRKWVRRFMGRESRKRICSFNARSASFRKA